MKAIFFMDVDTQRDLMLSDGCMHVPGAERLIPKLRRLFDFAKTNAVSIISSVTVRDPHDPEFATSPPYCVRGTDGQRKIDDTLLRHPLVLENKPVDRSFADLVRKHQQIIVEKQEFDVFSNPAVEKLLRVLPPHAILFGVPTESAVKLAALGLRRLGIKTALIQNATLALEPRQAAGSEAAMRSAGVEFIALEILLSALTEG
ncbi:MAG: isochorismatase family protein [Acidobacteriia bacterium]|nr:isochorismatase family protein [Terriglobia bacterium]